MGLSQEKISVILMRDSGESKRYRILRRHFRSLVLFCIVAPFVAVTALVGCYYMWQQNVQLSQAQELLQKQNEEYALTTKRLNNVQSLLEKQKNIESSVMNNVAKEQQKVKEADAIASSAEELGDLQAEGPGHEAFPAITSDVLKVENVTASVLEKDRLRIAFNLHNSSAESISGEVFTILILATGKNIPLTPTPADAGTYKITKFKSGVLFTDITQDYDLTNAQVILEAKDDKGEVIFRNIFPLTH